MLGQMLATIRSWMQTHLVMNDVLFLTLFGIAVVILVLSHFLRPPRT